MKIEWESIGRWFNSGSKDIRFKVPLETSSKHIKLLEGPTFDPDVTRTRNLLIWSQARYHCATESANHRCPKNKLRVIFR